MPVYLRITGRDGTVPTLTLGKDEKMFAQEYMELSAETILIIEQSQTDQYIEEMCEELKSLGLYKPEYEFYPAFNLADILAKYHYRD